ncbi:glycosyltransferase [Cellulomonas sp. ACRRI]|uniref:glycosyltransferase family 4 protein n=1 Tax=Cellulomonas sp. ACRRI TaxID=2918188 RepID=UPI001EF245B3|nr:glycosyltransferase [Cellulomonas sp. ACRRI]MCG7285418.1 glycosyltransferase [Cellulomonas sp. ACRRI]
MRIAVAYDCLFPLTTGGGERQYGQFADAWARAGHDVTYLTRRQWDDVPPARAGVDVVAVSGAFELYDDAGGRRPAGALRFAAGLFRHLVTHRRSYDALVVSALPVLNVLAARLALLGTRTRICSDFLEVWRPDQWLAYSGPVTGRVAAALQRVAVRISPLVSCHSRMNGRRLAAEGARRDPVVSPGLIAGTVLEAPGPRPADLPPTVLYVGRHIADKRVEAIPGALAWARERVPGLRAVVLGEGPQREVVRREVDRLGLHDAVDLPGFVPEEELDARLREAAVLVNPSRREGYGLVVVEACAVGTPVVLVDAEDNASVELVEDGVNGYVAASAEPAVLGAAIVRAVEAGEPLRRSARAWYEEAATEKTAERAALGILAALARL